jgi:CheY-like chemotaxis protein
MAPRLRRLHVQHPSGGSCAGGADESPHATLPLLRTSGRFAFVDDDEHYLAALQRSLPSDIAASFFVAPRDLPALEEALTRTSLLRIKERADLINIVRAQQGDEPGSDLPTAQGGSVAERVLRYFADPERLEDYFGLFSDYAMPAEDGVMLCARHRLPGLQRTLLTGIAGESTAIQAFNAGAIENYLPKHEPAFGVRLLEQFAWQTAASGARRGELLGATISPTLQALLASRPVVASLRKLLAHYGVAQYMVLGAPQGAVGITTGGKALWLQLETAMSFPELVEILQEYQWSAAVAKRVAHHQTIVSEAFMAQLGKRACEQDAVVLSQEPLLCTSVFQIGNLPPDLSPHVRPSPVAPR